MYAQLTHLLLPICLSVLFCLMLHRAAVCAVHVHLVDFFILQRGDNLLEPTFPAPSATAVANTDPDGLFAYERNVPKDVLYLGPSQEVWVIARFGAHRGDYM
jgi:hypothetical protein